MSWLDLFRKAFVATERGRGIDLSEQAGAPTAAPGEGADWFGPRGPMQPVAPPEVAGRQLDYLTGYNLAATARFDEPVDFATLRALADAYDPLRLIIERRKDQIGRLPWTIRAKHDGPGRRPKLAALPASVRERIADIEAFFSRPSYEHGFRSWLRVMLEDLFVLDAPAVYCERDQFGQLIGLEPIDGATVKRVIDDQGRTPRPIRWTGAPFMWNGQQVSAENHYALGFRVHGGLIYPPAYQRILKGLPAADLTTRDLIYRPLNRRSHRIYGFSPVEMVLATVNAAMRRQQSQIEYYREGNTPEAIYSLPAAWTPDQVQRFQDYWDNMLAGNLGRRRTLRFLAGGDKSSYVALKEPPLKAEFDEWLVRIICLAFSYPPTPFIHQLNRSTSQSHDETAEREGLEPLKQWAADLINGVIVSEFNSHDLEFCWIEEDDTDPSKQAELLQRYVDSGVLSPNEARERIGADPSPDPAASVLGVKTASGRVPISSEGEATKESAHEQA